MTDRGREAFVAYYAAWGYEPDDVDPVWDGLIAPEKKRVWQAVEDAVRRKVIAEIAAGLGPETPEA